MADDEERESAVSQMEWKVSFFIVDSRERHPEYDREII